MNQVYSPLVIPIANGNGAAVPMADPPEYVVVSTAVFAEMLKVLKSIDAHLEEIRYQSTVANQRKVA